MSAKMETFTRRFRLSIAGGFLGIVVASIAAFFLENLLHSVNVAYLAFFAMVLITCLMLVDISRETLQAIQANNQDIEEKVNSTRTDIQQFIAQMNQCTFMKDASERLETMAHQIRKAQKSILLLSELSRLERSQGNHNEQRTEKDDKIKELHAVYLLALEEIAKKKRSKDFELLRVIVPPLNECRDDASYEQWRKEVIAHPIYGPHFEKVQRFHKTALVTFKNRPPQGVSILIVDDHFLMLQYSVESSIATLNEQLEGGLLFNDHSKKLIDDFKLCFNEMKIKGEQITV
jgi:hypothetical protein